MSSLRCLRRPRFLHGPTTGAPVVSQRETAQKVAPVRVHRAHLVAKELSGSRRVTTNTPATRPTTPAAAADSIAAFDVNAASPW
jgi:hypothetical protein